MNKYSFLSKAKLYKIRLVSNMPTLFGDRMYSNEWNLLEKTLDDDVHKNVPLSFEYPNNKKKVYYRRHLLCPANGSSLLAVGQFRDPMDFSYVFITLHSKHYKGPYIAIEKYLPFFRNPDNLADMVAMAFNWVLRNTGCEVRLEPWDTKGEKVYYLKDFWESYNLELYKNGGRNLIRAGYEDSLEAYKKQEDGKNQRKKTKKITHVMDRVENYISKKVLQPDLLLAWLDENVKDKNVPIDMMRPVRLLINVKLMTGLSIVAFNARYHKEGLISVSSFNNYTNEKYACFENDSIYEDMKKNFDVSMYI